MITCPNCQTTNVRVNNGNFARVKCEGEPAAKYIYNKFFFYCEDCEEKWESTPEAERDYFDYVALRDRTTPIVRTIRRGESYGPAQYIDPAELSRRIELAKKLILSYKHLLDLGAGEWYEIEQDSVLGK